MIWNSQDSPGIFRVREGHLDLEHTFTNGQMFRWRRSKDDWWDAVSNGKMLRIRRSALVTDGFESFEFFTYPEAADNDFLSSFFRMDVDLATIYEGWKESDPYLGTLCEKFAGLRIVRQDPEECLLSFICSTANFIPRIMKAVAILANTWGEPIVTDDGKVLTHSFPKASTIAEANPDDLISKTGLEWRGANLIKVAKQVASRPPGWLDQLAALDYATARDELMRLEGVGPKIADCVCLFALAKDQAVPVDTHVWQLTRERYMPNLRGKSPSAAGYAQVLNYFHSHFEKAGWAQQYLFYDHLLDSRAKNPRRG